ncbi:DNA topoisomerase I [Microgenomates group bacterium RBG_16_45_19]|mgnify:CR=1 FL=1|nr:MAG: DNA topoisomerase I [Microgenomates group bacterium RBG_16_45_19]
MKLVIVESPTKAKTLGRYLGDRFTIKASMGHLIDLPKSQLGVDVKHQFKPVYEVGKGKGKILKTLQQVAKKAELVYLATDPDREGEAIAWHIKQQLKLKRAADFKRVTFHEITKEAIEAAIAQPGKINQALVDAQQARRVVDRLVGYNLSPVLWKKVRRGLSAGRVQSVAVKLMVEREKEIKAFKPQEYWQILVKLQTKRLQPKADFIAELYEVAGKKVDIRKQETGNRKQEQLIIYLDSEAGVKPIVADLKKAIYQVETVERKERVSRPYPPYTTSTLQQAAANVLGFSGKQTMRLAQDLYEAGLITYHRTDSLTLAQAAVAETRRYIAETFGKAYLPEKAVFYKTTAKNAQEAHEAIRPTVVTRVELKDETNGFTSNHQKLYRLIWRRLLACQMMAAVYDATSVTVLASGAKGTTYRLKANGSIIKFDGWRKVYELKTDETRLPDLVMGEKLKYLDLTSEQKFTQPPPRYNDASLVKELEKRGIGRPSTYAPIISTIIYRGYVERLEKRFVPTPVGETVTGFLDKNFKVIMDYDFTAEMEEDLDRIARGEKDWTKVMAEFYRPFAKQVKTVEREAKRAAIPVEETGEKCPECTSGRLVIRSGRFGKFLSCSRFPECKYTASYTQKLEGFACPKCGGEVVLKRTRKGRSFWGCGNYPKCDYASWQDPRQKKE